MLNGIKRESLLGKIQLTEHPANFRKPLLLRIGDVTIHLYLPDDVDHWFTITRTGGKIFTLDSHDTLLFEPREEGRVEVQSCKPHVWAHLFFGTKHGAKAFLDVPKEQRYLVEGDIVAISSEAGDVKWSVQITQPRFIAG